jgi:CDP-paratose 2-epimerase
MIWLVTGGCGFVGTNLADCLLTGGEAVVVVDNLSRIGSRENLAWLYSKHGKDWRFVQADIRHAAGIQKLIGETQPQVIAHLAGQVAMTTSIADPRLDFEINALGTLNVLEAVRLASPATSVFFSSTNKVYGELEQLAYEETAARYILPQYPFGLDESLPLDGHSPYGCSKLCAEQYIHDYYRIYGIRTVVFRHSSMYGGRQYATFDQGWIGWFCQKALDAFDPSSQPFTINGNGKQVRDVLYADDLVDVYLRAAQQIDRAAGRIYNIGGGVANSLSLLELFDLLEKSTGHSMRYEQLPWRLGDQKVFIADYRNAKRDLGWEPRISKTQGVQAALEWARQIRSESR